MKFLKLYLENFRKFTKAEFDFGESNLSVICGPNEAGKSTIHDGIVSALYGLGPPAHGLLSKIEAKSIGKDLEPKVKLTFIFDGQEYMLERNLEKGKAKLLKRIIGNDFEELLQDQKKINELINEKTGIFGPEVFNKTISIQQTDISNLTSMDAVSENLEKIFSGGETTLLSVDDKFDKLRKSLLRERNEKPGIIDIYRAEFTKISADLSKAELTTLDLAQTDEEFNQLSKLVPEQEERLKTIESLIDSNEKKHNLESKLTMLRRTYKEVKEKLETLAQLDKQIIDSANNQKSSDGFGTKKLWISITSLILLLIGIALSYLMQLWVIMAIPLLGLILALIAIIKLSTKPNKNSNSNSEELKSFRDNLLRNETGESLKDDLIKLEMEGAALHTEIEKLPAADAEKILIWNQEKEKLIKNLNENRKRLEDSKIRKAVLHTGAIDLAKLRGEKEYLTKVILEKEELLSACRIGQRVLALVKDKFKSQHLPELEKRVNEVFTFLTDTHRKVMLAGTWPEIHIIDHENLFPSTTLSQGTLDQLYFSLRIACADLLSHKVNLPVIFDDSLVHFDSERRAKACLTISKISEERQVIYLTHDKGLANEFIILTNTAKLINI